MDLEGRKALVTGSAVRVGRRIALRLADAGCDVAVHYRTSDEEARETAEEIREHGVSAATVQGDLSKVDEAESVVDDAADALDGLDVLVNSASVFYPTPVGEVEQDDWDRLFDVNLRGPFFTSQQASERMEDDGVIVNIADWAGFRPYQNHVPYCTTKAGVIAMTKGLAKELAPDVRVAAVAPGPVMLPSSYTDEDVERILEKTPLDRVGSPDDVAHAVEYLVEAGFVTGAVVPVDGGRLIY